MSPSTSSKDRAARPATTGDATKAAKGPGRVAQMRQAYGVAKQVDPKITQWMLGVGLGVLLVFLLVGLVLHSPILWGVAGLFVGVLAAAIVMARRTDRGAYAMIEGKPGAALAALSTIRRGGWYITQEPIAVDGRPQGQDMTDVATVYRCVGRPGVVLVAEGPANRATKLLATEVKKVERFATGAPVHTLRVGEGEGTTPARKLAWQIQKMKPVLTEDEARTVERRLKAMQTVRPGIPAGMDPTRVRPSRAAARGR